jgi:hypothetical protein
MFPIGFSGEFEIVAVEYRTIEILLQRLEQKLRRARARNVRRNGNKVSFKGGFFRIAGNWNVLNPVSSGEIEIVPGNPAVVKYRFSFVQLLVFVTVVAASCMIFLVSIGAIWAALIFPPMIWLSMFGLGFMLASARLPPFVLRAMQD